MKRRHHFRPKLNKQLVAEHDGYRVYSVDPFAVRNVAQPDEEFTNFATSEQFPGLIRKREIWISDRNTAREGLFFVADALAQQKEKERGASEDRAMQAGLDVERKLREKVTGMQFRDGRPHKRVPEKVYVERYTTLPDPKFPVEVWRVDGNVVRSLYKTDYTEGGHGYVYRWVPKHEIWVERDLHARELPYIVSHEYIELRLMRDEGLDYDTAHDICSKVEFQLRKGRGVKRLLAPGTRRFGKRDLPKLPRDEVLAYVVRFYVK